MDGSLPAGPRPHAPSWYAATANPSPPRPKLQGEETADVCVVGAGFTGVSAALSLAEQGASVVVLEAARVGWGASGRNGGQIVNGYSRGLDVIARGYGAAAAEALGAMAFEGGDIIRERVARYAIDCALADGNLFAAFTARQARGLEHQLRVWQDAGHAGMELLDGAGVRRMVATDRYVGGLLDPRGGHLHPLNLVLGEAAAFESLGGRIREGSAAVAIEADGVRTASGRVRAGQVLVCGNAYLDGLEPRISGKIMPVSSQMIATETLGEARARALIPSNTAVEDCNFILDYYRLSADHRLLYGGGTVYGGRDPASVEAKIRPHMLATFPSLADVRIDYAWSGNFALTLSRIPHVGRLGPSVLFSHGDSGHGVTTTHLLGRLLAEAASGRTERFDAFARLPHRPFPGGRRLRAPITALGASYYSLRDRLGV